MSDKFFMQKALQLAARGAGKTSPNPMVGAVIVKSGKIIAQGYHNKAGTPHAEIVALNKAGSKAKGATLYLTLEPCCHTDKKTPPCVNSIIESGIKRVVFATKYRDNKGIKNLEEQLDASVSVEHLNLEEIFLELNR